MKVINWSRNEMKYTSIKRIYHLAILYVKILDFVLLNHSSLFGNIWAELWSVQMFVLGLHFPWKIQRKQTKWFVIEYSSELLYSVTVKWHFLIKEKSEYISEQIAALAAIFVTQAQVGEQNLKKNKTE